MKELDKKSKLIMWSKIKELKSKGQNHTQIGKMLEMDRHTVGHYASMTFEQFCSSASYNREYAHKLDKYEDFVLGFLGEYPFVSAAVIHDRLKENYPDMIKVSDKTVFNFVKRLRLTHSIPKEEEPGQREMHKLPESAYGDSGQVDFGEGWMFRKEKDNEGKRMKVKVYFMVMVLCRSRYKFVYFSKRPFTSEKAVYAHELAFQYFGGKPKRLIYDQDRVFIKEENLGDYVLTKVFKAFCASERIEPVFCRKSDPQSKGKIESVVGYVKHNFLPGREYQDDETLNREAIAWLERTANGTEHKGIREIPAEVFKTEQQYLIKYEGIPALKEDTLEKRAVRRDNTIMYGTNFYSVPGGTYKGRDSQVYVEAKDGVLHVFDIETGKMICEHGIFEGKGKTVTNANHLRSPELSLEAYRAKVMQNAPCQEVLDQWMDEFIAAKGSRYLRDNLKIIEREAWQYSADVVKEACHKCRELKVFNACELMKVAETIRKSRREPKKQRTPDLTDINHEMPDLEITVERSQISTYEKIMEAV